MLSNYYWFKMIFDIHLYRPHIRVAIFSKNVSVDLSSNLGISVQFILF